MINILNNSMISIIWNHMAQEDVTQLLAVVNFSWSEIGWEAIKILLGNCILSTLTTSYEYQWISFIVISEYVEAS